MDPRIATTLAEALRRLPEPAGRREFALQRLVDLVATEEALDALRTAADEARAPRDPSRPGRRAAADPFLAVLSAASDLCDHDGAALTAGRGLSRPALAAELARVEAAADPSLESDALEQLARAIASPVFLAQLSDWVIELRGIATTRPATGACTVASALQLWMWTLRHVSRDAYRNRGDRARTELAEAFSWLLAARFQILAVVHGARSTMAPADGEFFSDLCHVYAARSAGVVAARCAELVFGYRRHPAWDREGCSACYHADDLETLEGVIPGIASSARAYSDVIEADGSHPAKAGPCVTFDGVDEFIRLRTKLDGCLTGARLTKDRAAAALPRVLGGAPLNAPR